VGDPFAMAMAHAHASGMGGMRAAGDLVARLQMTRGMKINDAKQYVAGKLKISVAELTDPVIMTPGLAVGNHVAPAGRRPWNRGQVSHC
jgi:hypothetical protein